MPFLTPESAPYPARYRALLVPDSADWLSIVSGALIELTYEHNWEAFGAMTPEEAAVAAELIFDSYIKPTGYRMIGEIVMGAWDATPAGFLACDGAVYLVDDYPELAALLAAEYTTVPGSFRVPDLRGRVAVGAGPGYGIATSGGDDEITLSEAQLPVHSHSYFTPGVNVDLEAPGVPDVFAGGAGVPSTTGTAGAGAAIDIRNPFEAVGFYIVASL